VQIAGPQGTEDQQVEGAWEQRSGRHRLI
jgi:hypothetical protein